MEMKGKMIWGESENQAKKLAEELAEKVGGWADMQYPENYLENQAKKLAEKAGG